MSIAALLQAAEYLERRDRGKLCVKLNYLILLLNDTYSTVQKTYITHF